MVRSFRSFFKFSLLIISIAAVQVANAIDPLQIDFDHAMNGVKFDLEGDNNGAEVGNGIPDATEMALVAEILRRPDYDLSETGGASHKPVRQAFETALEAANNDLWLLRKIWGTSPEVIAGYSLLGATSFQRIKTMTEGFGASLDSDYTNGIALEKYLSAEGDADGDGVSNRSEYLAADKSRAAYLKAALDPSIKKSKEYPLDQQPPKKRQVGILLYPGFELLDVYGPVEMWSYISDFEVIMLAEKKGPVKSAQGISTLATHSFDEVPQLDIVLVPGGFGTQTQLQNDKFIEYIRQLDKTSTFTTSVCTGSALLAKAGVLDGQKATSNKRFFYLAEQQSEEVNWVAEARWVESGKYFTSSGVSAGTDMALGLVAKLYGKEEAENLASSLEYEWQSNSSEDKFAPFIQRLTAESTGPAELIKTTPLDKSNLKKPPQYLHFIFNKLDFRISELNLSKIA